MDASRGTSACQDFQARFPSTLPHRLPHRWRTRRHGFEGASPCPPPLPVGEGAWPDDAAVSIVDPGTSTVGGTVAGAFVEFDAAGANGFRVHAARSSTAQPITMSRVNVPAILDIRHPPVIRPAWRRCVSAPVWSCRVASLAQADASCSAVLNPHGSLRPWRATCNNRCHPCRAGSVTVRRDDARWNDRRLGWSP